MIQQQSLGRKVFTTFNYVLLTVTAVLCLLPLINVLAVSFSSNVAASSNMVKFWPVDFTLSSYKWTLGHQEFLSSFLVSIERLALGVPLQMLVTILVAYPLSKNEQVFKHRKYFVWYFMVTMLFSGGLIPVYMTIKMTGLLNSIWSLIIPNAVVVWYIIMLLNFFRAIPKELEEAAFIDGASHWKTLVTIYIPVSLPAMATITLFCTVFHWNSWFDGLIYINLPEKYPLQSYLQTAVVRFDPNSIAKMSQDSIKMLSQINDRTTRGAQLFVASIPILAVYPFLQRYFMTGIVMGSVKG